MRILTVFGTRPEAIKLAPVIRAMQARKLDVIVCATGQHRDMLDQMLEVFSIRPDYDLDIMQANQSPLDVASRIFAELTPVIAKRRVPIGWWCRATRPPFLRRPGSLTITASRSLTLRRACARKTSFSLFRKR